MKKLIAGIICAVLVLGTALSLSGCGDKNYPVKIANLTIDKEPKSIVVLDPNSADIISYMGYDVKIVGRSREVDQKYLDVAPVMGSAVSPSVQDIIDSGATVVFANEGLNDDFEQSLEKEGIAVIKMSVAETPKQLETNYHTIGKILGGNDDGDAKAASSYDKLISAMEQRKSEASAKNATALDTVCYLYYEQGGLRLMTSGTYGDMLLGYTGSVNVAVNIDENKVDVNTLKVANPKYIFYADDSTLKAVQADPVLSKLAAVTGGKTMQITKDEMSRQGLTALETLEKMIGFIHPELAKAQKATEPTQQTETKPAEAQAATQAATEAATQAAAQTAATQAATQPAAATSVADKYKIDLKDLSLKEEDDNDDVKAMQQRLFDLGYVSDKENITGYFGEISKKAVSAFQKASGIKETGEADNATLVKLFASDAKKSDTAVDESSASEE
ncbi:MAG: peptidoglycan-binding protein [Ruminococcus sp.]|nr:peptidoglycan-binding protein [Ruminococcus sp.]